MSTRRRAAAAGLITTIALATAAIVPGGVEAKKPDKVKKEKAAFTLTILHNNDGESSLLPTEVDGVEYGGVARFQSKVDELRDEAGQSSYDDGEARRRGVVLLNSGDNYLPGATFQASQQDGAPFYDAVAVDLLDYDALGIGNHEFDFGPATFARFVESVPGVPFVSANLDYSGEPTLAGLEDTRLVDATIVKERGVRIGVVGLTTPSLPTISSPGGVEVLTDLAGIALAEIDALTAQGVDKIVLISHLQGLDSELALTSQLRDVDVVIGGGGDEVLADAGDPLFPGDVDDIFGTYPQIAADADGNEVPVVTTPGNYRYVGALQVTFDRDGNVIGIDGDDSGINVVASAGVGAVEPDARQQRQVVDPVSDFVDGLASQIIGSTGVVLDCERSEVRGVETNCGNLIADGLLTTGQDLAADFGVDSPQLAIINGGGIRGEIDQEAGPISVADTFRLQPFGNLVAVAEDVPAETVRQIFEEGAIRLPASGDGGFAQLAGGTIVIDTSFQARVADQNTGEQITAGERVRDLVLDDGTVVVADGVTQDVTVDLVGLNFSLGGGDAYPAVPFTNLGVSDQQALQTYIEDTLGGTVTEAEYPRGGEGRITIL